MTPCQSNQEATERILPRESTIAILPNRLLGDNLVYLVVAVNLMRHGYRVSYFGDHIKDMQAWFPAFTVYPAARTELSVAGIAAEHDLLMVDPPVIDGMDLDPAVRRKVVELSPTGREYGPAWECARAGPFGDKHGSAGLKELAGLRLRICGNRRADRSMVDWATDFCKAALGLPDSTKRITFDAPEDVTKAKHGRRVVVFPTTPRKKKEYPRRRFVSLIHSLLREGWKPVVAVMPGELSSWSALNLPCELRSFDSTAAMAAFVYESCVVISNDSGAGHLASMLGVPTVTVTHKREPLLWRPGWSAGCVVRPSIVLKLRGRKIWSPFISHRRILKHVGYLSECATQVA